MNLDLSELENRTVAGAGRGVKKFAPKAAAKPRRPAPATVPTAGATLAQTVLGPGAVAEVPADRTTVQEQPLAPQQAPPQEVQESVCPPTSQPATTSQQQQQSQPQPQQQQPQPQPQPAVLTRPKLPPARASSPERETADAEAHLALVPADPELALVQQQEQPKPGELNMRGKRGKRGRGQRSAGVNKPIAKPNMQSDSLRHIALWAAQESNAKEAAERRKQAAARQASTEAEAPAITTESDTYASKAQPGIPQLVPIPGTDDSFEMCMPEEPLVDPSRHVRRVIEDNVLVNGATYASRAVTERWTHEETTIFYAAVETFGLELSLIAKMFQHRNRKSIKAKFTREEKNNRARMNAAVEFHRKQPAASMQNILQILTTQAEQRKRADELDGDTEPPDDVDLARMLPMHEPAEASEPQHDSQAAAEPVLNTQKRRKRADAATSTPAKRARKATQGKGQAKAGRGKVSMARLGESVSSHEDSQAEEGQDTDEEHDAAGADVPDRHTPPRTRRHSVTAAPPAPATVSSDGQDDEASLSDPNSLETSPDHDDPEANVSIRDTRGGSRRGRGKGRATGIGRGRGWHSKVSIV